MNNQQVLEHIDGLKDGQSTKSPSSAKTVLDASSTGDRTAVLEAMLASNAAALDLCRSAVGHALDDLLSFCTFLR
jgi:hypothetical protein